MRVEIDPDTNMPREAGHKLPENSITAFVARHNLGVEQLEVRINERGVEAYNLAIWVEGDRRGGVFAARVIVEIPAEFRKHLDTVSPWTLKPEHRREAPIGEYKLSELLATVIWMMRTLHYSRDYSTWLPLVKHGKMTDKKDLYVTWQAISRDLHQLLGAGPYIEFVERTGFYPESELV